MDSLAIILFCILALIASVHYYWAIGGLWPGKDEASLARTVVGEKNITKMPSMLLTSIVAMVITLASLWPLMWRSIIPYFIPQGILWFGMIVLMAVFLGRGIAGYMPFFNKRHCEQPFSQLNALYFSPLCLAIGVGFVILLYYV